MNTIVLLAFLFAIFGLIAYVITIFNGLIALKNDIAKAGANIDILLKQRHDELPKLFDVCKVYMELERDTLQKITQARSMYQQAVSVDQKAQADQSMTSALRGFFAVAENYPQLKANDNFMRLQIRISELEERVADRREFFNDDVNTYNTRIGQIPEVFVASFMSLKPRGMFKVSDEDQKLVEVKFQNAAGA